MSKLKAKDLMIGDYLLWNGSSYRVTQVNSIDGGMSDCNFMLENGVEDEGEPISLTPETLEVNGFELLRDTWYFSQKGRSILIRFADDYIVIIINGDHVPMKLRYVHQLQHALKLCGIKKEIKL